MRMSPDTPIYLRIRAFGEGSALAAKVRADVADRLSEAEKKLGPPPPQAGSPIKSLREWGELLGSPPTIGHPLTHERHEVPLHLFADRDPDAFFLTISWVQYAPNTPAARNLPPPGQPIIEVSDS